MAPAPLLIIPLLVALSPVEMEFQATQRLVDEFARTGQHEPIGDPVLADAARRLAKRALSSSAAEAGDQLSISEALSDAQGHDANPHAYIIAGSPPEEALRSLLSNEALKLKGATHLGIGAAVSGEKGALAVLLPKRKTRLKSFARTFAKTGGSALLCGELVAGLERAEVYVARPTGSVDRIPLTLDEGREFCAPVTFGASGRHTVEVMGHGSSGPEIAALFFVDAGTITKDALRSADREPTTLNDARHGITAKINALRRAHNALDVRTDDDLNRIAQEYADELASTQVIAHVSPTGEDLAARLKRGGFDFQEAGENLGLASGPLAAHFGIEHSPGHRFTLIDRAYGRLGIGVAFQKNQAIVVELLASTGQHLEVKYREVNGAAPFVHYPRQPVSAPAADELASAALNS
ncbi:MAG: CAP domain-containing protein, partial [Myxococcaceae bacterium]